MFTIYRELHPKSDVDKFYIPRKDEGGGLIAVEIVVSGVEVYVIMEVRKD